MCTKKFCCIFISSKNAIVCWGSNKWACAEAGQNLDLKIIHISVLWPFPIKQFEDAVKGVSNLINVENNKTGQIAQLLNLYGFRVNSSILKYDGRPFTLDELKLELGKIIK